VLYGEQQQQPPPHTPSSFGSDVSVTLQPQPPSYPPPAGTPSLMRPLAGGGVPHTQQQFPSPSEVAFAREVLQLRAELQRREDRAAAGLGTPPPPSSGPPATGGPDQTALLGTAPGAPVYPPHPGSTPAQTPREEGPMRTRQDLVQAFRRDGDFDFRAEPAQWPRVLRAQAAAARRDFEAETRPGAGRGAAGRKLVPSFVGRDHGFTYAPLDPAMLKPFVKHSREQEGRSCPPTCAIDTAKSFLGQVKESGEVELVQFANTQEGLLSTLADEAQDAHERATLAVQVAYTEDTMLSVLVTALHEEAVQRDLGLSSEKADEIGDYFVRLMGSGVTSGEEREHGWILGRTLVLALQAAPGAARDRAWVQVKQELASAEKQAKDGKAARFVVRGGVPPPPLVLHLCGLLSDTYLTNNARQQQRFNDWRWKEGASLENNAQTYAELAGQCEDGQKLINAAGGSGLLRKFVGHIPSSVLNSPGRGQEQLDAHGRLQLIGQLLNLPAFLTSRIGLTDLAKRLQSAIADRNTQEQLLEQEMAVAHLGQAGRSAAARREPAAAGQAGGWARAARPLHAQAGAAVRAYATQPPEHESAALPAPASQELEGTASAGAFAADDGEEEGEFAAAWELEADIQALVFGVRPGPPPNRPGARASSIGVCPSCCGVSPQPCLLCAWATGDPAKRQAVPEYLIPLCEAAERERAQLPAGRWTATTMQAFLERLARGAEDPRAASSARRRLQWQEELRGSGSGTRNPPLGAGARRVAPATGALAVTISAADGEAAEALAVTRQQQQRLQRPSEVVVAPPPPAASAAHRAPAPGSPLQQVVFEPRAPNQGLVRGGKIPPFRLLPFGTGGPAGRSGLEEVDGDLAVVKPPPLPARGAGGTPAPGPRGDALTVQELLRHAAQPVAAAPEVGPAVAVPVYILPAAGAGLGAADAAAAALREDGLQACGGHIVALVDTAARIAVCSQQLVERLERVHGVPLIDASRSRHVTVADNGSAARPLTVPLLAVFVEADSGRVAQYTFTAAVMPNTSYDMLLPTGVLAAAGDAEILLGPRLLRLHGGRSGLADAEVPVEVALWGGAAAGALFVAEASGDDGALGDAPPPDDGASAVEAFETATPSACAAAPAELQALRAEAQAT